MLASPSHAIDNLHVSSVVPVVLRGTAMNQSDPFNDLIERLCAGDDDACASVYRRFADQLLVHARRRFSIALQSRLDAEDIVQSVFRSFFRGCRAGQFDIDNWDHLWGILAAIAHHKCNRSRERHLAARRDVRRDVPLELDAAHADLRCLHTGDPNPEETAVLADLVTQLVDGLAPPGPQILLLQLEGHTHHEIRARVGCSFSTVRRTLDRIRDRLRRLSEAHPFLTDGGNPNEIR